MTDPTLEPGRGRDERDRDVVDDELLADEAFDPAGDDDDDLLEPAAQVRTGGEDDGSYMEVNGQRVKLAFASVQDWVHDYLLELYRRPLSGPGTTWCPEWWRHEEAIVRLDALWRSWEFMRLDPATGISNWLHDHCDYHMEILLSADGPFRGCTPEAHGQRTLKRLPGQRPPDGFSVEPLAADN